MSFRGNRDGNERNRSYHNLKSDVVKVDVDEKRRNEFEKYFRRSTQQTYYKLFTDDRWSEYKDILLHLPTYYMYQYSDPVVDVL